MNLVKYSEYLVGTVDTDCLVLKHLVISGHSAEYASVRLQLVMG